MIARKVFHTTIEVVAPFNFQLTVHKPAGWWWSTPSEIFEKDTLWTATRHGTKLLGIKIELRGTLKPRLECSIFSNKETSVPVRRDISAMLKRALRVEDDLNEFYALAAKDEVLRPVIKDLYGMRANSWPDLFPALILAVTLQMAPWKRSNQMMNLLMEKFGEDISFDGKMVRYWPSPETLSTLSSKELRTNAKLGYRAENLLSIVKTLKEGFPSMDEINQFPPEDAKKKLMTLRGIGDYSAEIIMPRMGFPLDVWSAKIFNILFFKKPTETPRDRIPELKKVAEGRWGKWRSYVFVYVLNDLPNISKRLGVDLTVL